MADSNILKINPEDLTLGDIEMIEDISGQPIGWFGKDDHMQGKMLVAAAYAIGLKDNPGYTMDQARRMRVEIEIPEESKGETPLLESGEEGIGSSQLPS